MFMVLCQSSALTKAAEMISAISGTQVNLVAKHWIQRIPFTAKLTHDKVAENQFRQLITPI
jgi:hypothetical protein